MRNLKSKTNYMTCLIAVIMMISFQWKIHAQDQPVLKKRIAVFNFIDETDNSQGWGRSKTVGEGLSEMLVTELVKSGKYRVIERDELNALLHEQDLGDIVTPESAAQAGKVLGVEIAVFGTVTEFGNKDKSQDGGLKDINIGLRNQASVVAVDVRLINTTTGEILDAEQIRKEKSNRGVKFRNKDVNLDTRKGFDESVIGKAAREAVQSVAELINENAGKITWNGRVVTLNSGYVYINAGANDGLESGHKFTIYRAGEDLVDPQTGLKLGDIEEKIGMIKVIDPSVGEGKAAKCEVLSGNGIKQGDVVRVN